MPSLLFPPDLVSQSLSKFKEPYSHLKDQILGLALWCLPASPLPHLQQSLHLTPFQSLKYLNFPEVLGCLKVLASVAVVMSFLLPMGSTLFLSLTAAAFQSPEGAFQSLYMVSTDHSPRPVWTPRC